MESLLSAITLCAVLLPGTPSPAQAAHKTTASRPSAAARPSLLRPASLTAKAPAEFKVSFSTTCGDFIVQVHRDWAPLGADRFYNLVRNGFFTNASFFRVVPNFVAQFGLSANPAVSKAWRDAKIQDDPVKQSNKRGTLVFAMAGPNTRTTQFFLNFKDNARLDGMGFAPFGEVVQGMENVDKIYPGYGEQPQQDLITEQGDAYLTKNFRELDKIKFARVVPATPVHPVHPVAHKPAAH
ncbi:MAG TPA: peptidylprolyl isomerase [Terracidiphilus sp.]|jgi:peptidyl-prolyl cis-trans isomerase A (cyclophilin A)